MAGIEDDVRTLASRVASVATDQALKTPGFARGITSLDEVLEAARARAAAATPTSADIREELAAVRQALTAQKLAGASLAGLLATRSSRREQLSRSSGENLQQVCDTLQAGIGQLSVRVARLEAQVQAPARRKEPMSPESVQSGGHTLRLVTIAACASLAALAVLAALHFWPAGRPEPPGDVISPPPVHDAWQTLWGEALRQPAQCTENQNARSLVACLCPDLQLSPSADPASRCPLQTSWPAPLNVAAVQAVLNVKQKNVWVDERLGPVLADALQQVPNSCALPDEVQAALQHLAGGSPEDEISPGVGKAAMVLLKHMQEDPSCAR
jgi:hypothetical protein